MGYLSNRKKFVQMNNAKSFEADITMGVPQDSIMGPLLFIMNDIIHSSNSFKFIMFADDTKLFEQTFTKCKEHKSHDISYTTKVQLPSNS